MTPQARMRKSLKDQENSSPDAKIINSIHDATPIHAPPPLSGAPPPVHEVLRLEICHPVPSLLSEVACVRLVVLVTIVHVQCKLNLH